MNKNLLTPYTVFERGWLSSNNILFVGTDSTALVDTGYCTHNDQTLALVKSKLNGRPLDHIINTHLHSDHCGGNATLQSEYGAVQTHIPCGQARDVTNWDDVALSYQPTGQSCPRFQFQHTMQHGDEVRLGDTNWQVHAAPGHDPHSIILFEPETRTLISADALWQNGFGVIFQEIEGDRAFDEVAQTLDAIERLNPLTVIPGHGAVFKGDEVKGALAVARKRLHSFVQNPHQNTRYGAKVLLKFKLLEQQSISKIALMEWVKITPFFNMARTRWFSAVPMDIWVSGYIDELLVASAARLEGELILNV